MFEDLTNNTKVEFKCINFIALLLNTIDPRSFLVLTSAVFKVDTNKYSRIYLTDRCGRSHILRGRRIQGVKRAILIRFFDKRSALE